MKTIGQTIVEKSKSPFCNDLTLSRWIDGEIESAIKKAVFDEQNRIVRVLSTLSPSELDAILSGCKDLPKTKVQDDAESLRDRLYIESRRAEEIEYVLTHKIEKLEQALAVAEDALDNKYRLGFKDGHTCCMAIVKNLNYEVHIIIEALEVAEDSLATLKVAVNDKQPDVGATNYISMTLEKIKVIKRNEFY